MVFTSLENTFNLSIFTDALVADSNLEAKFYENLFPSTKETEEESHHFLYQNSVKKYKDDMEHWVIYILYDL